MGSTIPSGREEQVREWHDLSGIPYPFPDIYGPGWMPLIHLHDGALGLKLQLEAFLWFSPWSTTRERGRTLKALEELGAQQVHSLGLDEVVCWVPPTLEASFGPRLRHMGWIRSPWSSYSRRLR